MKWRIYVLYADGRSLNFISEHSLIDIAFVVGETVYFKATAI